MVFSPQVSVKEPGNALLYAETKQKYCLKEPQMHDAGVDTLRCEIHFLSSRKSPNISDGSRGARVRDRCISVELWVQGSWHGTLQHGLVENSAC
jgi:hypothetical protein